MKKSRTAEKCYICVNVRKTSVNSPPITPVRQQTGVAAKSAINDLVDSESVTKKLDSVVQSINNLAKLIQDVKQDLDHRISSLENKLLQKIKAISMENVELKASIVKQNLYIDSLEQNAIKNCVDIVGFPPADKKELRAKVLEFFPSVMNVVVESANIVSCFQKSPKNASSNIVSVQFSTDFVKEKVMSAKRDCKERMFTMNGNVKRYIYINDSLTLRRRILYKQAQTAKREMHYQYLWTQYGKILMRKESGGEVKHIISEEDLQKL